jgi:coproporphyrinogen III oxidase
MTYREKSSNFFKELQINICNELEAADGKAHFITDKWSKPQVEAPEGISPIDSTSRIFTEGGGITRVIADGDVFEKGGVNFSEVHGKMQPELVERLIGKRESASFYATGISLVIHPLSPFIPTVHANYRYIEVGAERWFGGGSDLTPYYCFHEDAVHFHNSLKKTCDIHDKNYYPHFKKQCDEYFFIPHRKETRGVGGIFFDYLGQTKPLKQCPITDHASLEKFFDLVQSLGNSFTESYLPIVEKRKMMRWTEKEKDFQLYRRGRYAEFNLVYDRGTYFGLKTDGRIESILMSLPPFAKWIYNYIPDPGSKEEKNLQLLSEFHEWV